MPSILSAATTSLLLPSLLPLLLLLLGASSDAFLPSGSKIVVPAALKPANRIAALPFVLQLSSSDPNDSKGEGGGAPPVGGVPGGEEGGDSSLSFDDAAQALKDREAREKLERSRGAKDEAIQEYEAKAGEISSLRDQIRARTSQLGIEKSQATAEAIAEMNRRAVERRDAPEDSDLNMDVFQSTMFDEPEKELTEEQMAEIDPVGQLSWFEQAQDEFKNTKWPSTKAVLDLVITMVIFGALTATFILKSDKIIRHVYTDILNIIPKPDEIPNYDEMGMDLPDDWFRDGAGFIEGYTPSGGVEDTAATTTNTPAVTDALQQINDALKAGGGDGGGGSSVPDL